MRAGLVSGRGHYDSVIDAVRGARQSVWIATANLKELLVAAPPRPGRRRAEYRSVLEDFEALAERGVELRILHASLPSGPFRSRFDEQKRLVAGGMELRMCPRVHLKAVLVDARLLYLGSANWTGAGLGVKGSHRRNFELGIVTDDEEAIDAVQELYERIWRGAECKGCGLRDQCDMPLDLA
jgi:phosphatidylserine/phosphatidylglycerophosphate/cardiolipin synthase-like enzyme